HYQITLNDGSRVWINENSKLIFPAKFASDVREVILEGEAYFEVVPNEKAPFIVKSQNNSSIRVLGTKFNINNQGITTYTTLVEGSVEVQSGEEKIVIKPSEQAIINAEKKGIDVREVDVNFYTSWKDGKFTFKDMSVHEIMSKIGKWYHIQVEYDNINTQNILLSGSLRKYETFREIIEVMEATNIVEIKIKNNNTIKIYKK
ncbi:MAG: FecR family protein, partial [Rikenellaceae bacterium]